MAAIPMLSPAERNRRTPGRIPVRIRAMFSLRCIKHALSDLKNRPSSWHYLLAVVAIELFVATSAHAALIQVDLDGHVEGTVGTGKTIQVDDPVHYTVRFNEQMAATTPTAVFLNAVTSFSGTVGWYNFSGTSGRAFTRNDGTSPAYGGGAPYDQVAIDHANSVAYQAAGLNRNDFTSTDGDVGGYPLRSFGIVAQSLDTSLLAGNDFTAATFYALRDNSAAIDLQEFNLYFSNDPFALGPVAAYGSFDSITVNVIGTSVASPALPSPSNSFSVPVLAAQPIYIDPEVAVGYDYSIGAGDPGFRSVVFPSVGGGQFDLFLFDSAGNAFDTGIDLTAGTEFNFIDSLSAFGVGVSGLDRFGIRGVESSAALDPNDPLAFITELTFVADGNFTGTMMPVTAQVSAGVPEPSVLALLAFPLLLWIRRNLRRYPLARQYDCTTRVQPGD